MSMLDRYQKPGGFKQLVTLIETCGKQKQDNFLKLIELENPLWAEAVSEAMLSLPKILAWKQEVLAEIASKMQNLTLATLSHSVSEEEWEKMTSTFSLAKKRQILELKSDSEPLPNELVGATQNFIQETRKLIADGFVKIEKFAPELFIEEDIEEKLNNPELMQKTKQNPTEDTQAHAPISASPSPNANIGKGPSIEVQKMFRNIQVMSQENAKLKDEIKALKEKLSNIKKMAA